MIALIIAILALLLSIAGLIIAIGFVLADRTGLR